MGYELHVTRNKDLFEIYEIACALSARVIGDDGEEYGADGEIVALDDDVFASDDDIGSQHAAETKAPARRWWTFF